ncbi:MAG: MBL fold metallo-hydrolase [Gammaproteobacteria bacterium]
MTPLSRLSRQLVGLMVLALMAACSGSAPVESSGLRRVATSPLPAQGEPDQLTAQFLGAGGVFLRVGDQALLADPFFSNPPMGRWLLGRELPVKTDVIDAHLPPLEQVQGVLVGHGHFDHAMDVPYVMSKLPADIKVYGSETIPNLLAAQLPAQRLIDLTPQMADAVRPGQWLYLNPQLRILPIASEHSPHLGSIVFASDKIRSPMTSAPRRTFDWQAGTNVTYVIDFLDPEQQVQYRVFYQSSASGAPVGFPPSWLLQDGIPFDLALLCAANFNHVEGYPEGVLGQIKPKQVMLIHWEQFWDDYSTTEATPLPGLDFAALEIRIRSVLDASVPVWVPMRGAYIQPGR